MLFTRFLLQPLIDHPSVESLCAAFARGQSWVELSGLTTEGKAAVIACLSDQIRRPIVVLVSDNEKAELLREATSTFLEWLDPEASTYLGILPGWDCTPYEGRSPHPEIAEKRAVTLWNLARGRIRLLLVPLAAALGRFREKSYYPSLALELKVGDELDLNDLADHLAGVGYERGEPVEDVGQFSVRGGIVDVYPPECDWPVRIEFLGDEIESLRQFDPGSQRSRNSVASTMLLPLVEKKRSPQFFEILARILRQRTPSKPTQVEPEWLPEYSAPFPGWEFFAPLVEPHSYNLFSLAEKPVVVWDEPFDLKERLKQVLEGWTAAYEEIRDSSPRRPRPEEIFLTEHEFLKSVQGCPQLGLLELEIEAGGPVAEQSNQQTGPHVAEITLQPDKATASAESSHPPLRLVLPTQPAPNFPSLRPFMENLQSRLSSRETVVLVSPTAGKIGRLKDMFHEYEIPCLTLTDPEKATEATVAQDLKKAPTQTAAEPAPLVAQSTSSPELQTGVLIIARGVIGRGVIFSDLRLAFLSDSDLFGSAAWGTHRRHEKSRISTFISSLSDLKVGDYVVHVDHGIGIYRGLRQLETDGSRRDFMLLTYQGDARLYVPLERLDLIEKYRSGGEGAQPQLDRLGGATWERTKTRVKRAMRDMAQELLRLYAERKMHGGRALGADTPWQTEFEEAFEFEETPDQLRALEEIKKDLISQEPMDRLLCGDVGYGKTELAMRAAFKAVQESRQVAVLAPTTVLAFQHFETFRHRMAAFPIRVEMLSRFRSRAEQKKVLADAEAGKVDILIGTHRMLSKDVHFRDLGLLIVDEEQRFGVAAKEKLKKLKAGVDVLTMSATPIPRTLHMSLGGLRDFSVIETPPQGRLSIQTTVAPFNQALIQAAIMQEIARQGQVFFVHNRVESIFSIAAIIQRLVPTARLGVAHGQMGERELERVMLKFMEGQYDVLVSTALIENGLDIPRANTIIVNRAERFGLADLYQLRGRVGRSNRRAYAYFLIPTEESLTPTAKRRLTALKEFSDLGAGFRLAALDLELRGAGNLLGREQHGQLNAVGIDLYLTMLEETVKELKGAPAKPEVRTTLNLGLDIKIPDQYISDESQRLRMYKRISSLSSSQERAGLEAELNDRYGPIPPSVETLLDYALLKSAAEGLLVQSIERKAEEVWIRFHEQAPVDPKKLMQFVRQHREANFRPDGMLRFHLRTRDGNLLEQIQNVLQELQAAH